MHVTDRWSLVRRVLSVRPFSLQALKSAMLGAWRPKNEFVVQEVADGFFFFVFIANVILSLLIVMDCGISISI